MGSMKNEKIFSWEICSGKYVSKEVDKSFYKYGETIIPIELRECFDIQQYQNGDEIEMKVIFKGKEYITSIRVENNFNRSKLILGRELRNEVVRYIDVS